MVAEVGIDRQEKQSGVTLFHVMRYGYGNHEESTA